MSEYEFTSKRVSKMKDNAQCTPVELLRHVLYEIESGEISPDCLIILAAQRDGSGWDMATYRANLSREAEIAVLASAQYKAIRDWVGQHG